MTSPSEHAPQRLVPRLMLEQGQTWTRHICLADDRFRSGAVVTLQALCGTWCYGYLYRMRKQPQDRRYVTGHVCAACQDIYFG